MKISSEDSKETKQSFPKKLFIYLSILTASLIIVIIALLVTFFKAEEYKNTDYNFSFKYPKNWSLEDLKEVGLDKYLIVRIKEKGTDATFQVKIDKLTDKNPISYKDLAKDLDKNFEQEFEKFEKISSSEFKLNSRDALDYNFDYDYKLENGDTKRARQKMIIVIVKEKVFYITGQGEEGKFGGIEKDLQRIIKTFIIK